MDESEKPLLSDQEILKIKARAASDCMLEQYFGTAAGVGIGLALGLQRKNIRPFVVAITVGTFADWVHGYSGPCRGFIEDYKTATKALDEKKEGTKS
ncbi:hypothetical protein EON65_46410 [archaeon]|nr:MAG: hypothetical protein EON65_46410 [archaeon]